MSRLQVLYDRAPVVLQNVMVSAAGYQRNRERYGREYWDYRRFLEGFDRWPLADKLEYQRTQLQELVSDAAERSPFYGELYEGIDVAKIRTVDDLRQLPVVDKEMLRANIDRVVTIPRRGALEAHTGGTTGKSLVTLRTLDDNMRKMATLDHFKAKHGFEHLKMRRATFNGKHIVAPSQRAKRFWRYNAACKQMIYSSFHLTEENLAHYVESLNKFRPDALDGFFSSICDVASYIERHGIALGFRPVAIFPTSETLTPSGRELLERVFGCKVYDQYSSSEAAPFLTECSQQVLHIDLASGVFEHFNDSDEVLVTSFTSHGTPLIRYRIGDSMVFGDPDSRCACGDESPTVTEIRGRRLDFLFTAEGAKVNAGNVSNLFKNVSNAIIRAQTVQERMDHVQILLEVDPESYVPAYDDLIKAEFRHKFGPSTRVTITHVEEIPREASGKFRLIANRVPVNGQPLGTERASGETRDLA